MSILPKKKYMDATKIGPSVRSLVRKYHFLARLVRGPTLPVAVLIRILNRLTSDEVLPINQYKTARIMILTDYNQSSESN